MFDSISTEEDSVVVLCSKGETPPSDGELLAVFKPHIPAFFIAAYRTAACSQDAFGQLCGLLDLWSSRGVMDVATVAGVRARMLDVVCSHLLRLLYWRSLLKPNRTVEGPPPKAQSRSKLKTSTSFEWHYSTITTMLYWRYILKSCYY